MSGIFGILGLDDHDYSFLNTLGQNVIFEAANEELRRHTEDLDAMLGVFVEETTESFKERYKLPGGGRLQRISGQTQAAAVKAYGSWDVAYPLEDFGAQVAQDRIDFAYATMRDLDRHLDTVELMNINTVRFEVLKALLNNNQDTFDDRNHGNLSIEPLANDDTVVYPPVLGSEDEATEDHYLESGYAAADISDANDPYVTIVDELEEHFGAPTAGGNIVTFINNAQRAVTFDLTDFDPVIDRFIQPGDQQDVPVGLPMMVPGRILGRHNHGTWVVEWRWIPANYMVGIHLDAPKPLKKRVHPASTSLPTMLQLVSESDIYPFTQSHYEHHFGFGCANRLNGVVLELGTGGSYTIPTAYA